MTSNTRPWLPTNWSPSGAFSNQPQNTAPLVSALGTLLLCMKASNSAFASVAILVSFSWSSASGKAPPMSIAITGATTGRSAKPSM